jgi:hypothetical protein
MYVINLRNSPDLIDSPLNRQSRDHQSSPHKMELYKSSNDNQEVLVDIVPDGDCILVVGPDMMKLRVHSLFLSAVSKPFFAMFAPRWKKGDAVFSQSEPSEIFLPEDNATSMRLICAIIHHQNQDVPNNLSAHNILGVAVAADKYDCVCALRFASEDWFRGCNKEAGDLVVLAAAAYLLWNEKAFREITKTMILTHSGPYHKLCSVEVESVMDWKVFCECFTKTTTFCWLIDVKAYWKRQEVSPG